MNLNKQRCHAGKEGDTYELFSGDNYPCLYYTIQNAMIIPMYAGLLSKRVSARAGTISLAFSGVSILIWELVGRPMGIHSLFVGLAAGLLSILIAGVIDKTPLTAEQYAMVDAFRKNKSFTSTQ